MGHADNEELRDSLIGELTEKHLAKRRAALIAGDKTTLREVSNSVLDYLTEASDLPQLVQQSLINVHTAGKTFACVLERVMRVEAECDAIREVEMLERIAERDPDNFKPKTRAVAAFLCAPP